MSKRVLKVGLIGGGGGAFIVNPHQKAIHFDGTRRVTCAALHQDPKLAMKFARSWPYPIKGYPTYDDAISDGVFHPNCVHFLRAVLPSEIEAAKIEQSMERKEARELDDG